MVCGISQPIKNAHSALLYFCKNESYKDNISVGTSPYFMYVKQKTRVFVACEKLISRYPHSTVFPYVTYYVLFTTQL